MTAADDVVIYSFVNYDGIAFPIPSRQKNFDLSMTTTPLRKSVTTGSVRMFARLAVAFMLGAVFTAPAMTLGELQGSALIGRPLDLRVPVRTSPGEQLSENCVRAEIHYGEAQQKAARISIEANQLRLQIAEAVYEPVVKIQVRTSCAGSQIRSYVLLSDLPADGVTGAEPGAPSPAEAVQPGRSNSGPASAAIVMPQRAASVTVKPGLTTPRKTASSVVKNKKSAKKPKAKVATTQRARERKAVAGQPNKSVLKLDPTEVLSDRMDNLELNMPFKPADDALQQGKQIEKLQAELKATRELAAKNDSSLVAVRSQLQQAQSQLQMTPYLYGLIALLCAGVAGLAWLWRSQKKLTAAWWQHASTEDLETSLQPEAQTPAHKIAALESLPGTPNEVPALSESPPTFTVAPIKINTESVQDIRQQTDFFVSLGQNDRAIHILNQHVAASDLPNPLICMDLLALYHQANQVAEFDRLRDVCQQHFRVQVPDLDTFQHEGKGLVGYPDLLTSLTRLWPREPALVFMDNCIFLKDTAKPQSRLDLAAFRDLLTLHVVAEELALPVAPVAAPANKPANSFTVNELKLDFVLPEDIPPTRAP